MKQISKFTGFAMLAMCMIPSSPVLADAEVEQLRSNLRQIVNELEQADPEHGFIPFGEQMLRDELTYLVEDLSPENLPERSPRFQQICSVLLSVPEDEPSAETVQPDVSTEIENMPAPVNAVPDSADESVVTSAVAAGMAELIDLDGRSRGYIQLTRHEAGLECRLYRDAEGAEPFDVLMTTVVKLTFAESDREIQLRVRDYLRNQGFDGTEHMRGTETNYFSCGVDKLEGLDEREARIEFIAGGQKYRAGLGGDTRPGSDSDTLAAPEPRESEPAPLELVPEAKPVVDIDARFPALSRR